MGAWRLGGRAVVVVGGGQVIIWEGTKGRIYRRPSSWVIFAVGVVG